MYMNYFVDWSDYSGRINGFRLDLYKVRFDEEGRNSFDICCVAFFRNYDDADLYYEDYIGSLEEEEDIETDPPAVDDPTEAPTNAPTEAPTNAPTEAPTEMAS